MTNLAPLCPLCANIPTKHSHPFSDTGMALPFAYQRCYTCELPCRYWGKITALIVELRESTALLGVIVDSAKIDNQIAANEAALQKVDSEVTYE